MSAHSASVSAHSASFSELDERRREPPHDTSGGQLEALASDWSLDVDDGEGRHATWLELFFDLVFVLAIAQLSAGLFHRLTSHGALVFVGLFVPVWWAWVGVTFYETRYECQSDVHRMLVLVAMVASTAMALGLRSAFAGHTAAFALGYAAQRSVLVLMYGLAHRRAKERADEVAALYMRAFAVGALLWAASALVPPPWRYAVWMLGLAFDIGAPLLAKRVLMRNPVDGTHMPERFGAFVIIVLGESVVAVGSSVSGIHWTAAAVGVALCGFLVVACVWWTYFDLAAEGIRRVLMRRGSSGKLARDAYAYWHFPLVVGLVVLAVGIEVTILRSGAAHVAAAGRWTLAGGIAAYLSSITGAHLVTSRNLRQVTPYTRLAAAVALILLAAAGGGLSPLTFAFPVALITLMSATFETLFIRSRRARRTPRSRPSGALADGQAA